MSIFPLTTTIGYDWFLTQYYKGNDIYMLNIIDLVVSLRVIDFAIFLSFLGIIFYHFDDFFYVWIHLYYLFNQCFVSYFYVRQVRVKYGILQYSWFNIG